jgi:TM2 domain-containing membrane protein YozV
MPESRVQLKDPRVAALLAWLIPGAGHLYQGRTFKAAIFFFCILGTFTYGLALADWQGVYFQTNNGPNRRFPYGYIAQFGVGAGSLPALIQYRRAYGKTNVDSSVLEAPLDTPFKGIMDEVVPNEGVRQLLLDGQLKLSPVKNDLGGWGVEGSFVGTKQQLGKSDPAPIELKIAGPFHIEAAIGPEPGREVRIESPSDGPGGVNNPQEILGRIPRSFVNSFQAPLEETSLQQLHGRLGKRMEIALVFTWIAGFLNILAIWDAFEGPAYGYGDEEPAGSGDGKPDPAKGPSPATA